MSTRTITGNPPRDNAAIRGMFVGVMYEILLLFWLQALLEPTFTWLEVAIGVALSFIVAETCVRGWEPSWQEYRDVLAWTFVAQGVPIIICELVRHLLLGAA
jgi:hypothetical protein